MGQVSSVLRRGVGRYLHWCPACQELHPLPDSWTFDGDLEQPTFSPSFKHSGGRSQPEWCCHYTLVKGMLHFAQDCSHAFKGQVIPLPPLPEEHRD
jgi:hypothetical protein